MLASMVFYLRPDYISPPNKVEVDDSKTCQRGDDKVWEQHMEMLKDKANSFELSHYGNMSNASGSFQDLDSLQFVDKTGV